MRKLMGVLATGLSLLSWGVLAQDFNGAIPSPIGKTEQYAFYDQIQITFPAEMQKAEAFAVRCIPEVAGSSSWANNNTVWTYSLRVEYPGIPGGTQCTVEQTEELRSLKGQVWPKGTIQYGIQIMGPNVDQVTPLYGFNGFLRESEALVLIKFNGDIDQASFWQNPNVYLNYLSGSAPAEKIRLSPVPDAQIEDIKAYIAENHYMDTKKNNWVVATVRQNLIPGAKLQLNVSQVKSAYNPQVVSEEKFTQELVVRGDFKAEISCARPSENSPVCLPIGEIAVNLNAKAKWSDVQKAYLEYVPYKGKNLERVYPSLPEDQESSYYNQVVDFLSQYIPVLSRFSETLVERVVFHVQLEPETVASVYIPQDLRDIDQRELKNTPEIFQLQIGSPQEAFRLPSQVAFFEKGLKNLAMPVGVVNLNQKINVRKSGTDPEKWTPVQDMKQIVALVKAYASLGNERETAQYTSPMQTLNIKNSYKTSRLTGEKNRSTYLTMPFAKKSEKAVSGTYIFEISSEKQEKEANEYGVYQNPKAVIAQVTDLNLIVKKGPSQILAWVTSLSTGQSVANASLEIRNCLGDVVSKGVTNASGLATFQNQAQWASDCGGEDEGWSSYTQNNEFFVVAKTKDDFTFAHSSWYAENSWAMGAPGVEYFYSEINEGNPFYHAVIGVNLVKPGQKVPVQIFAKMPTAQGLADVPANRLAKTARIYTYEDPDVYYDFPLKWQQGSAELTWAVPAGSAARLGQYAIQLQDEKGNVLTSIAKSDIEVAEFKVPLMSGSLAFAPGPIVKPEALPVNASIRYANGIGAKGLEASVSYYFTPTAPTFKDFDGFVFGNGEVKKTDSYVATDSGLPDYNRPALIEDLETNQEGSLTVDLAKELTQKGKSVGETLKSIATPQTVVARVRYQDQMGEFQTLSQSTTIYTAPSYVGTQLVSGDRAQARLNVALVESSGKALNPQGQLELQVLKIETRVIGEELYGGLIRNTYEREMSPARWTEACSLNGSILSCQVGTLKEGAYAFVATASATQAKAHVLFKIDAEGRIYGNDEYMGFGDEESSKQLPLTLNQKSYKIGDKAVVSFSAPFEQCSALVTLERESVVRSFVSPDACRKGFVEIPVIETLAPNVFVSINLMSGRTGEAAVNLGDLDLGKPSYRLGFANLLVELSEYKLDVEVATNKEIYKPRETVQVTAKVTPEMGSLKNATVTFIAIEEKILELKANETYDLLQAFLQLRGHSIDTFTLLDRVSSVSAKDPDGLFDPIAAEERKSGDEGGDGSSPGEMRRRLFDALVKMETQVPVVNGLASWQFQANDSLTKFKVIAVVTDTQNKLGTGGVSYLAAQDTQTFANLPPSVHTGDQFPVRVNVQNNTNKDQTYRVVVEIIEKDSSGKILSQKTLDRSQKVASASAVGIEAGNLTIGTDAESVSYVVKVYDEQGNLVDSLEPDEQRVMTTVPLAIADSFVEQMKNGNYSRTFTKEPTALTEKGDVTVVLSSSLVSGAINMVQDKVRQNDLENSIFIKNQLLAALLLGSSQKPEQLQVVLEKLINFTDAQGLIKYYPQASQGSVWLTASILQNLDAQKWSLAFVPPALKSKLDQAVLGILKRSVSVTMSDADWLDLQTQVASVADSFGDAEAISIAKNRAQQITQMNQAEVAKLSNSQLVDAVLAVTQWESGQAKKTQVWRELTTTTRISKVGNQALLEGQPFFSGWYSDEVLDTGKLLLAFSMQKGSLELARPLAVGLVQASSQKWYVAETMYWATLGLKAFAQTYETEKVSGQTNVAFAQEGDRKSHSWSQASTFKMVAPFKTASETVDVQHQGSGAPWVTLTARTAVPLKAAKSQGLSLEKQIKNLTREQGFQAGDIIQVTLKVVSASQVWHVMVSDPVPAGSNIVGEGYGPFSSAQKSYSGYQVYFEYLGQGESEIVYQYQLNNVGSFNLPPTQAQGLYLPGISGQIPNDAIVVK